MKLEAKYGLRQRYQDCLKRVKEERKGDELEIGYEDACKYIDELYGYKDYGMLSSFINKYYENVSIKLQAATFYIEAEADSLTNHYRPNTIVLKEIVKFSQNVERVMCIQLLINNRAPDANKKNPVVQIKHSIKLLDHQWKCTIRRRDGSESDSRLQYLGF